MFGLISKRKVKVLLDEKEKEIQRLSAKLNKKNASSNKLSHEGGVQNQSEADLIKEIEDLKKENAKLKKKSSKSKKDCLSDELTIENESLKKKLKSAEDEIDDLEDELNDEKKRYQKKREEVLSLQDKYLEIEKENKENIVNIEKSNKKLKEQSAKVLLKNNSLEFVREILNAEESSSSRGDDIYAKIDSVVDYVLGNYRDCVTEFFKDKEKDSFFFNEGLFYWAAIEKKTWLKNKKTIAFVGEFSAGKTTIVNKILAQGKDSISLPVSTKATTAIPTYISGTTTDTASYRFFTPDNKLKVLSEKTFKRVDKGILAEVDGISNLIKYFVMSCNNENLQDLSLLDTPGFTSNDNEDARRTIDVINECDALFWVFDVNIGNINKSSLKIIKDNLRKPLFLIINKVDTKSSIEVDKVEKLIKETFKKENIPIKGFLRYSYDEEPNKILEVLQSIPRTNDTTDFKIKLKERAQDLLKTLETECVALANQKADADIRVDESRDAIENAIGNVTDICVDINDIIFDSYKKHVIKSRNKYEISPQDYGRIITKFKRLIKEQYSDTTPDVMDSLNISIEAYAKAVAESSNANEKYIEKREQRNRFKTCVNQLEKRLSSLK